jgi:hypothetical protein
MCSCRPEPGLFYLRRLMKTHADIALYPRGALEVPTPPEHTYFYRPAEVLLPAAQVQLFVRIAKSLRIRVFPLGGDNPPPTSDDPRLNDVLARTSIARYLVATHEELEDVIGRFERASSHELRLTPNHMLFSSPAWGYSPSGEPAVWDGELAAPTSTDDRRVNVAVIDGGLPEGFDANPLLNSATSSTLIEEEPWPYASSSLLAYPQGHGSFVCGVLRSSAPNADIHSYRALDADLVNDEWTLGNQIRLVLESGAEVINLSLGTFTRRDQSLLGFGLLEAAARSEGGPIVVAAAGNSATWRPFYPAADDWAIGVGAVELTGEPSFPVPASFTNYGPWVDVCANGVDVISAYEEHPYRPIEPGEPIRHFKGAARWSGTSFATPWVAGQIARLRASDPSIDRAGVLAHVASGVPVPNLGVFVP